ncbi:MAG TPA: hypothetical protein VK166_00875 [Chitinophagaceae bacterium]|nr:hypothetical protein [Chitinophagaceae bacterium]
MIEKILLFAMVIFYLFAGYYHFANPNFYYTIIPPYLAAWEKPINLAAGFIEIGLALLLIPDNTRRFAGLGIVAMLLAFIPSHIYFFEKGRFQLGDFTITPMIAWIRLLIIHPLLIIWAWWVSKFEGLTSYLPE